MSWMQTYHGNRFYPEDVKSSVFCIEDIAHALSNICRFGGHIKKFYSVAQHSVLVADIVRANGGTVEQELWALMHDSAEAYMVDVPTPVKIILKGYKEKEIEVLSAIEKSLGLPRINTSDFATIIKDADSIALITEAEQLVSGDVSEWEVCKSFKAYPKELPYLSPEYAKLDFLDRWHQLQRKLSEKKSILD